MWLLRKKCMPNLLVRVRIIVCKGANKKFKDIYELLEEFYVKMGLHLVFIS